MTQTVTEDRKAESHCWGFYVFLAIFTSMILSLFICLAMDIWNGYKYKQVMSIEDFGRISSATYTTSIGSTKTAIMTEKGTLLVDGTLQAISGHRIQIEQRANGDKALCVIERNVCKRILGD